MTEQPVRLCTTAACPWYGEPFSSKCRLWARSFEYRGTGS